MSREVITVRYDGPILADHQMDIADLAPALLGLSELFRIANRKFNDEKSNVKVLISTDVEHQCFEFHLQIVQTLWEHTKALISTDDVKSAKDLLELLGLSVGGPGGMVGVFQLLKWLKGRKIESTTLEKVNGRDVVRIEVKGDNNIIYAPVEVVQILGDKNAVASIKRVVQPLAREGYEKLEFESSADQVERISNEEASEIGSFEPIEKVIDETDDAQVITAWISVYSPVYDPKAPLWRFKFGDAHEYMDISETNIAEAALKRGGALVDDAYRVRLEMRQEHKDNGAIVNHYKIKEILKFRPAKLSRQGSLFDDESDKD